MCVCVYRKVNAFPVKCSFKKSIFKCEYDRACMFALYNL